MPRLEACTTARSRSRRSPPWIKTRLRTGPEHGAEELVRRGSRPYGGGGHERGGPRVLGRQTFDGRDSAPALLLPDRHGPAAARHRETRRVVWPRWAGVRDGHRGRPGRSGDGGAWLYRADRAGDPRGGAGPRGGSDPGLQRRTGPAGGGVQRAARGARAQRRDRAADLPSIRPGFRYQRSLEVLAAARAAGLVTKSNLILGLGEERDEISAAMADLHAAGCRPADDHAVPAANAAASSGRALGQARGVRGATRTGPADGLRRGDVRAAGPLVLPGLPPLPPGRRTQSRGAGAARLLRRFSLARGTRPRPAAGAPAGSVPEQRAWLWVRSGQRLAGHVGRGDAGRVSASRHPAGVTQSRGSRAQTEAHSGGRLRFTVRSADNDGKPRCVRDPRPDMRGLGYGSLFPVPFRWVQ